MSTAHTSAKGFFFVLAPFRVPQRGRADLLTDGNQFPHQVAKAAVLGDLLLGAFDSGTSGNDLGDRFSTGPMGQRIRRTVSWGILPGAGAVRLATLAETRGQKTWTQVAEMGQASGEVIAFFAQSP